MDLQALLEDEDLTDADALKWIATSERADQVRLAIAELRYHVGCRLCYGQWQRLASTCKQCLTLTWIALAHHTSCNTDMTSCEHPHVHIRHLLLCYFRCAFSLFLVKHLHPLGDMLT